MGIQNYNEAIVFLIRETGWTLEYIRKLPVDELIALVNELSYQKELDIYKQNYPLGILAAIWTSSKERRRKPEEFIGYPPKRGDTGGDDIWEQAEAEGIKPPKT